MRFQQFRATIAFAAIVGTIAFCSPIFAQPASQRDIVSVPQLLENVNSDNVRVAASAARTLGVVFSPGGRGGDELEQVTQLLIEKLDSPLGAKLRFECARALGTMKASAATDKMKVAMKDEDIEVAMAAGEAIGRILPVDDAREYLIEQGTDAEEHMLVAALHGIAPISKAEDKDFLLAGLASENWRAQKDAIVGLERSVRAGADLTAEQYDSVAQTMLSNIVNASNQAIHFFTHIRNEDSFAAVLKAAETHGDDTKSDGTWRMRSNALQTLYHLGATAQKQALPTIIRQLGDRTANVTNGARRILNELRKEHYVSQQDLFPVLLTELEKAESLKLRGGIMKEMGSHVDRQYASRVATIAAKTLDDCLEDTKEWTTRASALILIGSSQHTGSMKQVATCVADDISNVRSAAGRALEEVHSLCSADAKAEVAPVLQPLLINPVDWRKTAVAARAVGYYATAENVEPLTLLLSHSVINVRQGASHSLVTIANSDDESLSEAVDKAVSAELAGNRSAWEYGAPVLGALKDVKALPLLTKMLQGSSWHAQAAAADAVTAIASTNKVNDKDLSDALIAAGQSETIQVQDACDRALRALTK
ncbi:MAG: HEAT repeat protein [Pirellulaceae bacterium]|jgi:HEAT repeat protein